MRVHSTRDRERYRPTDRQTDRQTDREESAYQLNPSH